MALLRRAALSSEFLQAAARKQINNNKQLTNNKQQQQCVRLLITSSSACAPQGSQQNKNKLAVSAQLSPSLAPQKKRDIKRVTIIGAGSMGSGIATIAATSNFIVKVMDIEDEYTQSCLVNVRRSLEKLCKDKFPNEPRAAKKFIADTLDNIDTTLCLQTAVEDADIVIEAVSENLEQKLNLFARLDDLAPSHTILVSNTTSLPISTLAEATGRPDRVGGLHFNPLLDVQLLEIVKSCDTSNDTVDQLMKFSKNLGKYPTVLKDTPGFIVNRLLVPYIMEAIRMHDSGVATIEHIDFALREGSGLPRGPFELADELGLDLVLDVAKELYRLNPEMTNYKPPKMLVDMVEQGLLGRKRQRGFYDYRMRSPKQKALK